MKKSILEFRGVEISLQRKRMKNIYLRVHPDGTLHMSAPLRMPKEELTEFLSRHWSWAEKQRTRVQDYSESLRHYSTGDKLAFFGEELTISLHETEDGKARAMRKGERLLLFVPLNSSEELRRKAVWNWLRAQLLLEMQKILSRCEEIVGQRASEYRIRRMTSRWGTCNIKERRIWINLHLAKYPLECLEYILIHELTHLWVRNHGAEFQQRMDRYFPAWRSVRKKLNKVLDFY